MNTINSDLNLLRVAAVLFETKNTSQAALKLGITQSAVSHALARLRDQFKDPLFVRAAKGVEPTEFARSIRNDILELVERAERLTTRRKQFDPLEAEGTLSVATTDYFEAVVGPKVHNRLSKQAPKVRLSIRPTTGELPKRDLESGHIDLAIAGFYEDLPEGYYRSSLFSDSFLSAVGKQHTLSSKAKLTEQDFLDARHALITLQGNFRDPLFKNQRRRTTAQRRFSYGSYSFTGMAWVLQESDLLLTAPRLLIERYSAYFPMKTWTPPIDHGKIEIQMVWHEQTHEQPLRSWFRGILKDICKTL